MSQGTSPYVATISGFPRVSGDEPHVNGRSRPPYSFSPRERG